MSKKRILNRTNRFCYTKEGEITILELECEKCIFYTKENVLICEMYPLMKPQTVLRCEQSCPKFKAKK